MTDTRRKVALSISCLILGLLLNFTSTATFAAEGEALDKSLATDEYGKGLLWYDIKHLGVEGRGWDESQTKEFYDRLPAKAEKVVRPPVWGLSRHSAGMYVRFVTDATSISARWTLRSASLAMNHMAATGVSGLDLYVRLDDGRLHWLGTGRPTAKTSQGLLVNGITPGRREYYLYLPLYNGVESVHLGISKSATLAKAAPWPAERAKPICFYGTSITQGGCASRTGMTYAAILGRQLNRPTINLGFSGNGRMELEVAQLLAELDPAIYVIDCLPNMGATEVAERTEPLVRAIRKAHPETPIVLAEDRTYANAVLRAQSQQRHSTSRAALRKAYDRLISSGVKNLHYMPGEAQLGDDGEDTVDGSHPTDLGFFRMSEAFLPVLKPLLSP